MNVNTRQEPSFLGNIKTALFGAEQVVVRKVDHVMEAFRSTIADLEAVATEHASHAAEHAREIEARTAAKLAAEAEALKATGIAAKMKAIFN